MQSWRVLHPAVGSSVMSVLSWACFLTANVQMRFPLWVPNVSADRLQTCWWSVSLQVTEPGPCAFNFMQKKIPVEKLWVSTHWDCSHHIFFFLINISWPVNQQSVILLIKKKVLQPIKYIYCPHFKVLIKDPSLMKIFLEIPSEVHEREGRKPRHTEKETCPLTVSPWRVCLGPVCKSMRY